MHSFAKGDFLQGGSRGWRECCHHPDKPAIRDCSCCGKPICKECASESGDPLFCAPCKESLIPVEEKPVVLEMLEPAKPPPSRDARVAVGELTVFDDGRVQPAEKQVVRREEAGKLEVKALEPEPEPEPVSREEPARPPRPRTWVYVKKETSDKKTPRKKRVAIVGKTGRRLLAGTSGQLINALPYALAAGILVIGVWLTLAAASHQWTQMSVVTCGIAVPWACYKGATVRKHEGEWVSREPPGAIWISILSTTVVAGLIPAAELLAYEILYRTNPELPFSDFMERYFKTTDWMLVAAGLLLAFLIPFLLQAGKSWRKPSFIERKKSR